MKTKLFSLVVLGAFILGGCAKKPLPPDNSTTYDDSYAINGGGFSNTVYNISSVAQQKSTYDATSGMTTIQISGTSGDSVNVEYVITFAGNTAKTYTLAPTGDNVFTVTTTPIKNSNALQIYTSNSGAKLVVTNYGGAGGKVTGTFSGVFNNTGNNYTFSSGTFSATVQ